jgi:hypothetical protein
MTDQPRTLRLNAFLMTAGHHEASWRLPESDPHAATSIRHYINLAQIAERAAFDSRFLADGGRDRGLVRGRRRGRVQRHAPALPSGLELFAGHVVPILQKRGLFHRDYPGRTLREHYGLPRPANQYLAAREPAAMRELPIRPRAGRATPRRGSSRSGG